jgi:hypothetical protein
MLIEGVTRKGYQTDRRIVSLAAWEKSKRSAWDAHADVIREEMLKRGLLRS